MKIRILNDAVRLRLDRDEVQAIARGETVGGATRFVDSDVFAYWLVPGDVSTPVAAFRNGRLTVTVPARDATRWANDDTAVSMSGEHGATSLLIEKDFECLDPRVGEDQSNRFRNPSGFTRP